MISLGAGAATVLALAAPEMACDRDAPDREGEYRSGRARTFSIALVSPLPMG